MARVAVPPQPWQKPWRPPRSRAVAAAGLPSRLSWPLRHCSRGGLATAVVPAVAEDGSSNFLRGPWQNAVAEDSLSPRDPFGELSQGKSLTTCQSRSSWPAILTRLADWPATYPSRLKWPATYQPRSPRPLLRGRNGLRHGLSPAPQPRLVRHGLRPAPQPRLLSHGSRHCPRREGHPPHCPSTMIICWPASAPFSSPKSSIKLSEDSPWLELCRIGGLRPSGPTGQPA